MRNKTLRSKKLYWRPWVEYFWSLVDVRGQEECWPWMGSVRADGYGQVNRLPVDISNRTRAVSASRLMLCRKSRVSIDTPLLVMHRCDNPICVNPDHLEFGTTQENTRQATERGRVLRGEAQPNSKLKQHQVEKIFLDTRLAREIASEYGVSRELIAAIRQRRVWGWLFTDEEAYEQIKIRRCLARERIEKNRVERNRINGIKNERKAVWRYGRKLTLEQARAIRDDHRSCYVVAAEYGINFSMVSKIRSGKAWVE